MSAERFSTGKRFHWQDTMYEVKRWFPEQGKVSIEDILTGAVLGVDLPTLVKALFAGELQFVVGSQQATSKAANQTEQSHRDLADYPEHLLRVAHYRLEVIQPLLALPPEKRIERIVEARVHEMRSDPEGERTLCTVVSVRSIYRWISDYTQSGNDIRALIPNTGKRGGKGKSRLNSEVNAIVESTIQDKYYVREKVTVDDILVEIAVRIEEENRFRSSEEQLEIPSRATVGRRIKALDPQSSFAAHHGKRAAKRAFTQYGRTAYPQVPLERVEIDHTRIDLVVIDDQDNLPLGRLTLTYCLDTATRYPLGYYMGFAPPSYLTVMECLHHAICPKEDTQEKYGTEHEWLAYGMPTTLVIDNGKEFIGQDLQDACLLLGIILQQTPVKTPHFKAGVERLFGSLNTMLFHTLPGTTFSNPQQRGDYNSLKQACIYVSDIDKIMNLFIVDFYAQRFHRGIEDLPAQRWTQAMRSGFAPRVPPNAEELSILLGRITHRIIQPYGIQFSSLYYNTPELALLRTRLKGEKIKLKYHPTDLSRLYAYDPLAQRYIEVPALDQEYTQGLSLWKHRIIRKAARDAYNSVDLAALGRAKRNIQKIVAAGRSRKRLSTRARIARWETEGKPTRQLETDSVESEILNAAPLLDEDSSATARLSLNLDLNLEDLADEGWDVSYDLPRETW